MAIKKENPHTLRYKFLSAITNPTVKNIFEAGRYGKTNNDKASDGRIADDESFSLQRNTSRNFILLFGFTISMKVRVVMQIMNIQKLSITISIANPWSCRKVKNSISRMYVKQPIDQSKQSQLGKRSIRKVSPYR